MKKYSALLCATALVVTVGSASAQNSQAPRMRRLNFRILPRTIPPSRPFPKPLRILPVCPHRRRVGKLLTSQRRWVRRWTVQAIRDRLPTNNKRACNARYSLDRFSADSGDAGFLSRVPLVTLVSLRPVSTGFFVVGAPYTGHHPSILSKASKSLSEFNAQYSPLQRAEIQWLLPGRSSLPSSPMRR